MELVNTHFRNSLEPSANTTSLIDLIYRNPNVTTYFSVSVTILIIALLMCVLYVYCKVRHRFIIRTENSRKKLRKDLRKEKDPSENIPLQNNERPRDFVESRVQILSGTGKNLNNKRGF